jgi:hypothetical protein
MTRWIPCFAAALLLAAPPAARAHCDTLDGPVVDTARRALDSGNVAPVLAWVRADDEAEIRSAFAQALAVRKLGGDARALADRWFFETVVRVHRAGEGAPYTGLKPAGADLGPAVVAADRAVAAGAGQPVEELLVRAVRDGVRARFAAVKAQKPPADDVAAGRRWVEAYVPYVHYVEAVHAAATGGAHGAPAAEAHPHAEPGHAPPARAEHAQAHPAHGH